MSDTPDDADSTAARRTTEVETSGRETDSVGTAGDGQHAAAASRRSYLTILATLPAAGSGLAAATGGATATSTPDSGFGAGGFGAAAYGGISDTGAVTCVYTNDAGIVETDNLHAAITDWRAGEVDTDMLRSVIGAWRSGEQFSDCT